ncbi:hypothetical protein Fmac_025690 [Flemingia macrophylla]|uniref:Cysteine protease n=1 Tax=Flemingia macrophylla TaxID=520843 RepID=A0ABD1LSY1_9FABA
MTSRFLSHAVLLSLLALGACAVDMSIIDYDESHVRHVYEEWLVKHGKAYNALGEKERRFQIFKDNLRFVQETNGAGDRSFKLGMNNFADLTNDEFRAMLLGRRGESKKLAANTSGRYAYRAGEDLPATVDWREKGAVAPKNARVVTIDGYEDVPQNDEKSLMKAVANQPISVAIEAGGREFQLYDSGVFTGRCGTDLDHGVVVVGYGTENGMDYWLVRNSWGSTWGENGYIKLERNLLKTETGKCGIAMEASYPIKNGANPPNPGPTPPSPATPSTVCDEYYSCSPGTTCCCVFDYGGFCFGWGCCPIESATCCDDKASCCPPEFPVCDSTTGSCRLKRLIQSKCQTRN